MYQEKTSRQCNNQRPARETSNAHNSPLEDQEPAIVKKLCQTLKLGDYYSFKKMVATLSDQQKKDVFQSKNMRQRICYNIINELVKNGALGAERELRSFKSIIGDSTFSDIINSNIFRDSLKRSICKNISNTTLLDEASMIVSPEIIWEIKGSPEFSLTFLEWFCNGIKSGQLSQAEKCWDTLSEFFDADQLDQILNSNEIFDATKEGLCTAFSKSHDLLTLNAYVNCLADILGDDFFIEVLDTQEVFDAVLNNFYSNMNAESLDFIVRLYGNNTIDNAVKDEKTSEAAINMLCNILKEGTKVDGEIDFLSHLFEDEQLHKVLNSEKIKEAAKDGLALLAEDAILASRMSSTTPSILQKSIEFSEYASNLFHIDFQAFNEVIQLTGNHLQCGDPELITYLIKELPELKITAEHVAMVKEKKYLNLLTIQKALEKGIDLNDKEALYGLLKEHSLLWQDPQISKPFEKGIEYFGLDSMFNYIDVIDLHDAMISFDRICELCDKFGTDASVRKNFYFNILAQVLMDNHEYPEGEAYQHLNAIARELATTDINNLIQDGKDKSAAFDEISELVSYFSNTQNIIASWDNLKGFMKLKSLIDGSNILEKLRSVKEEDPVLYNYIKALFFQKGSKVGTNYINEFFDNIAKFLARGDAHAASKHRKIKPSNYLKYGLSAEEIRTALITGKIDEIQVIRPMSMILERRKRSLLEYLSDAIVKKDDTSIRKASNPRKIYASILALELDPKSIVTGKTPIPRENNILQILKRDEKMRHIIEKETEYYKVEVCEKSNPQTATLGDATSCCMFLGSGKNNVYLFSGGTSYIRVAKLFGDGTEKTIAQCVLTDDINVGQSENKMVIHNIPINVLGAPHILTCDSVEIAPNYRDQVDVIEDCLRFFLKKYLNEYAESSHLEKDRVIIGLGYNKAFKNLQRIKNTFIPASLISYSDNNGAHCSVMNFDTDATNISVLDTVKSKKHQIKKYKRYQISDITPSDVIPVAVLENNIYSDNLAKGVFSINAMINAVNIRNSLYGKENFMFKVLSSDGSPLGYFLAYEKIKDEKKRVYIKDFALVDPKKDKALSAHMLLTFLKKYKKEYSNEETLPLISARFRESSAYGLIKDERRLNNLLSHFGFRVKVKEGAQETRGGEIFHRCHLQVFKNEATPEMAS